VTTAASEPDSPPEEFALCIIGAGISGLNALFAASNYLAKTARVLLVDQNPAAGGMWNDTYDYVRLHQPHRMFTAGNIAWRNDHQPSHLATKQEVRAHFANCLAVLRQRVTLIEYYNCRYISHEEHEVADERGVDVLLEAESGARQRFGVRAGTLIKAVGLEVQPNPPLPLSSALVQSLSPHDDALFSEYGQQDAGPIYVVGGGKTGMDTALALIRRFPGREINLIVGEGTIFASRNQLFPRGLKRWSGGKTGNEVFLDIALMFDGDNETEVFRYFRENYAVCLDDSFGQYLFGIMSEEENEEIGANTKEIINEYLLDVIDVNGRPTLQLSGGKSLEIKPGSTMVNCTGYIMRETREYEPFLSAKGCVVTVQSTSGIHFLTTFSSYFLANLYFLGKLNKLPLYELDYHSLVRIDKTAMVFASITQTLYNMMLIMDAVPITVINQCGLDFNRWYPLHRRVLGLLRFMRNRRSKIARLKTTLDRVGEKYAVHCGVLTAHHVPTVAPAAPGRLKDR